MKYFFILSPNVFYYQQQELNSNMSSNTNNNKTKTPFTQYFCNEDKGMKLRSGTVINCIKNTILYPDLCDLYENMPLQPLDESDDGVYDFATFHCQNCFNIINQLRFIERHHETLHNETSLRGIYQETLNTLRSWIDAIESEQMKCECWHYHSWRVTEGACMLTPEYQYLSSLDHSEYHASLKNKENEPRHPSFYRARALHRVFHNNFLAPTEELDTDDVPVKKHDYSLILDELKIWQRYFRREFLERIKAARKALDKTKIVSDCIDNILDFL